MFFISLTSPSGLILNLNDAAIAFFMALRPVSKLLSFPEISRDLAKFTMAVRALLRVFTNGVNTDLFPKFTSLENNLILSQALSSQLATMVNPFATLSRTFKAKFVNMTATFLSVLAKVPKYHVSLGMLLKIYQRSRKLPFAPKI